MKPADELLIPPLLLLLLSLCKEKKGSELLIDGTRTREIGTVNAGEKERTRHSRTRCDASLVVLTVEEREKSVTSVRIPSVQIITRQPSKVQNTAAASFSLLQLLAQSILKKNSRTGSSLGRPPQADC
jgi:hypothetical protein